MTEELIQKFFILKQKCPNFAHIYVFIHLLAPDTNEIYQISYHIRSHYKKIPTKSKKVHRKVQLTNSWNQTKPFYLP